MESKKTPKSATNPKNIKPNQVKYPVLLGMLYRYRRPNGTWAIGVSLPRIALVFGILFLILFALKSAFIYAFYKYQREYDEMSVAQALAFPFNRSEIVVAMGNYNIEHAKECLKEGEYREAFENLLFGVNRAPKNLEGKEILAQFFISMRKPKDAIDLLERGLPYGYNDLNYIRLYIQLLISEIEDEKLINITKSILDKNPESKQVQAYLAMAAASVYAMHGMYTDSKDLIFKYNLQNETPGILRLSKNEWEQGNREEAIEIISKNINKMRDLDPVYALLVNYYILLDDYEKARQYCNLRILENPTAIAPRIDYLRCIANSGDKELAQKELNKLFETNKNDEKSLLYIANYAADSGNIELMRKIYDVAVQNNYSPSRFCLLLLETFITCKNYKEAVDFSESIINEKPAWLDRNEDVFSCLRAVAYYALGNANMANALIREVIKRGTINPRVMVATARRFALLGENTMAHSLYLSAVERDPKHQYALVRLIQFELDAGNSSNLNNYIFRLMNMRRPPRDMILSARKKLLSDRFIFTAERENVINAIDTRFDMEKASGNRIFSDLPSDYDDEKILSTF